MYRLKILLNSLKKSCKDVLSVFFLNNKENTLLINTNLATKMLTIRLNCATNKFNNKMIN